MDRPNRGPLALVGGDELTAGNEAHDRALIEAADGGPAYVLATAAARQRPEDAVRRAGQWFGGLGLDVRDLDVLRRGQARSPTLAQRARAGRFFYLLGGDPGLVPRVLAGSLVWASIVEAWEGGAALAGSSAGAMALGEWTLLRERGPGDARRRYRPALGLLPGVAVVPHFDTFGHGWITSVLASPPRGDALLLGIDERSAAMWHAGTWRAFGEGRVTLLAAGERRRFASGEEIEGLPTPGLPLPAPP